MTKWSGGLIDWAEEDRAFISVVFSWQLSDAYSRALWFKAQGLEVTIGGPALVASPDYFNGVANTSQDFGDEVIYRHNPYATIASRGCPVGCWFCIVPKSEGVEFKLIPDFPVRPILCDNNLSALPSDYQDYIVQRYKDHGVLLADANSGFGPKTFNEDVYNRWRTINVGAWRFAYDEMKECDDVFRVMKMLSGVSPKRKRVYVLIGNEPIGDCLTRIQQVITWGGEPHVQAFIKLNAREKKPSVRHDWTPQLLTNMARYVNRYIYRKHSFDEYNGSIKTIKPNKGQVPLFNHRKGS